MLDIKFLENNPYFESITLKKSGVLFDEGDIDNNLYVIKSGSLSVQKYTTIEKTESKQLAILKEGDIFGEGALKLSEPKQVKIISNEKTILLKIDAKKGIQGFIKEFPKEGIELLTEIIDITNKRLLESNFLVTSNYSISKIISEIKSYDNKNLFTIINEFSKIIGSEYILYLEKNPVIDNYMTVKYDSRYTGKMQNNIVDLQDKKLDIDDLIKDGIKLDKFNHIEELKNKNEIIGYLIIGDNDNNFSEGQRKVISSISVLIAGVIKQKQVYEEERDKNFMVD